MVLNKLTGKRVRAKGPSLNAILGQLKWERNQVAVTQLSSRGAYVPMIVSYEGVQDTTWLDE